MLILSGGELHPETASRPGLRGRAIAWSWYQVIARDRTSTPSSSCANGAEKT